MSQATPAQHRPEWVNTLIITLASLVLAFLVSAVVMIVTDAEVAVRAFMLSAQQADLSNYREAINEMEGVQQDAFKRLEELDPKRTVSVSKVRKRSEERTATLNQWVSMTEQGRRTDAQTLAVSSTSWVMAQDVSGLQEVVESVASNPHVRYVMVLSPSGQVVGRFRPTVEPGATELVEAIEDVLPV